MGIFILGAIALYLVASIVVVIGVIRYARKNSKNTKRWGWGAVLVMYLIPFWDWLPTVAVHQYYCATESGFWVYKTLDQWRAENPGVMEDLHKIRQPIQAVPYGYLQILDERFAIETHRTLPVPLLTTKVDEDLLVDRMKGEVLAKGVVVGSGVGSFATGGGLKFWLNLSPCIQKDFWKLITEIENSRAKK